MQEKVRYIQLALQQLQSFTAIPSGLEEQVLQHSRLIRQSKMSYIEYTGDASEGHLWYVLRGIACSNIYEEHSNAEHHLYLWKKGDLIFQSESLFNGSERHENIQLWDDGVLLAMPYHRVRQALQDFPQLEPLIYQVAALREKRLTQSIILLRYSAKERVRIFLRLSPASKTKSIKTS